MRILRALQGRGRIPFTAASLLAAALALGPAISAAFQEDEDNAPPAKKNQQAPEQEVVIKREALKLTDPRTYRVSLQLQAAKSLELTAPVDGIIRTLSAKPQQKVNSQAELVRFDDARATLLLKRAKAQLQAAQIEKKLAAGKGDADGVTLAEARLEAAHADVELAQLEADQLIVRAPFPGEIERVHVVDGQFVRAGDVLATLVDSSKLVVEIPVERSNAAAGGQVDLRVEEQAVKAKVESVLPLSTKFDPLRELAASPTSVLVSIENGERKFSPGQTVYVDLIPLAPVTTVPPLAVSNLPDGTRKIQVLRDNVVRDLSVRIHGKVGTDSVFVSGRFSEGDEVVVSSTRALADGTPLRSLVATAPAATGRGGAGAPRPAQAQPGGAGGKKPGVSGF